MVWAIVFFIIAVITGFFGFRGAAGKTQLSKFNIFGFIISFIIFAIVFFLTLLSFLL